MNTNNKTKQQSPIDDPFMPIAALNGVNGAAPEGERPEPFNASSQSPGETDPYYLPRAIAGVIVLGLDVAILNEFTGPRLGLRLFPPANLAKAIIAFAETYKRTPTVREYTDILRDVTEASIAESAYLIKDPQRNRANVEDLLLRVTEYVVEWDDLDADECRPLIDRITREADGRRMRTALLDAREAMDRDGGLEEAWEIIGKVQPTTATSTSGRLILTDPADLLREPIRPVEWLWRPMLPAKTLALLTSYTGEGKTTLTYEMLTKISRGEPFLGMPTKQTNVMILAVEEDRDSVIRRLGKFAYGPTLGRGQLLVHTASLMASEQTYRDIRRAAEDADIGLIYLDTLAQFWTVKDENANAEVALAMREFMAIAHDDGRTVWVNYHDGKNAAARKSRGASALPGIVDLHLALSRMPGAEKADPRRVLSVEKRRNDETPWSDLTLTYNGEVWTMYTPTVSTETPADQIVQAIQTYSFTPDANPEGMTPREISATTGLEGGSLDRAIAEAGERLLSNGKGTRGRRYTIRTNSQNVPVGANLWGKSG